MPLCGGLPEFSRICLPGVQGAVGPSLAVDFNYPVAHFAVKQAQPPASPRRAEASNAAMADAVVRFSIRSQFFLP